MTQDIYTRLSNKYNISRSLVKTHCITIAYNTNVPMTLKAFYDKCDKFISKYYKERSSEPNSIEED